MRSRRSRAAVVLGVAAALAVPVVGGAPVAASPRPSRPASATALSAFDARVAARLATRITAPALGRDVAIRVYDAAGARTIFASHGTAAQLPASNMKLVTAATALTVLGPATRFPTSVVRGSTSRKVVVVGGGDPLLTSADVRALALTTAHRLVAAGTAADVSVVVDDRRFPAPTRATGWTSSYGLGEISPVRALGRHGVASADTSVETATYFVARLRAAGVGATYAGRGTRGSGATLAKVAGHRVDDDVEQMLRTSDNQVAETLFRQVALRSGRAATWAGSAAAARAALVRLGVPVLGARLVDGSGLSRSNRLTPATLTAVLRLARSGPGTPTGVALASLVPSLPVAGVSGTLRKRYRVAPLSCAAGRVQAKTGFVDGVVALSGVARAADGTRRVFSIELNHIPTSTYSVATTQRAVDALAATITGCY